ncbi:hypothetical protein E4U47_008331 [Claviceps purpurea]|nr:hypothetical protein E4U47_008331 [Claviceps purpurea]
MYDLYLRRPTTPATWGLSPPSAIGQGKWDDVWSHLETRLFEVLKLGYMWRLLSGEEMAISLMAIRLFRYLTSVKSLQRINLNLDSGDWSPESVARGLALPILR